MGIFSDLLDHFELEHMVENAQSPEAFGDCMRKLMANKTRSFDKLTVDLIRQAIRFIR